MSTTTPATTTRFFGIAFWPTALGVLAGIAVGISSSVPAIVMVCAVIYLLAAVTGRPNLAWVGFLASFPLIPLDRITGLAWAPLGAVGLAALVLVVIGAVRGTWRRREYRRQLIGAVVFSAIAVLAAALASPVAAGLVVVAGLLGHGAWDVWHHIRRSVVARPYAEFCAVLDVVLAVVVVVTLVAGGVA